jgi:hypothetical protein
MHCSIAKIDPQNTVDHYEGLIRILVVVPNKIALQLHDLELVVVHFGNDLGLPLFVKQLELLVEIDWRVAHVFSLGTGCQMTILPEAPAFAGAIE